MRTAAQLADDYIALWNEPDAASRRALLARTWTPGATYADPLMSGAGQEAIDALVAAVQGRFPGFRFALLGKPDGWGDVARFSWAFGPEGGEAVVKGTDMLRRDGDKIAAVTGFLDLVPQLA
ncbi:MAG: nuclear transport factor 2 family protein [Acetobacteraceae bacterium]|nr:nuclear transport factor 2 family protein [Acetobacteraceae bacterium]